MSTTLRVVIAGWYCGLIVAGVWFLLHLDLPWWVAVAYWVAATAWMAAPYGRRANRGAKSDPDRSL